MKYRKQIEALKQEMASKSYFTDYGFKEVQGIARPNPLNEEFLNGQRTLLIEALFNFLSNDPAKEAIEDFIINQIDGFDRNNLLQSEYHQLMLCFTGPLYFLFGTTRASAHYKAICENNSKI